jgi:hypothetical protein
VESVTAAVTVTVVTLRHSLWDPMEPDGPGEGPVALGPAHLPNPGRQCSPLQAGVCILTLLRAQLAIARAT